MIRRTLGAAGTLIALALVPRVALAQSAPAPASPAPAPPAAASAAAMSIDQIGPQEITWDANLEGGFGRAFGDIHARTVSFGRVRGGVLWAHGEWFTSLGAFYDLSNFTPGTFGIQLEQMHLQSGMWIQIGGGVDVQPRAMGMLAVGWSVLGVEAQYRAFGDGGIGPAIFGKLRIPLGIIGYALRHRK
jgi:hypothetical protein